MNSKSARTCIIDEDHPSCRACRDVKIGCDRKPRYVFDLTKDQFFPTYPEFLHVFENREGRSRLRKLKQAENAFRASTHSADALSTKRERAVHAQGQWLTPWQQVVRRTRSARWRRKSRSRMSN